MKRSSLLAFALAIGLTLLFVQFASAHAFIDHCTPEVGSTNAQPPKEVRCVFTAAVDARQAKLAVYDASNNRVDNNDLKADPADRDAKTLVVTLNTTKISGGLYTVKWEAVAEDGDKTDGQWQFAVGAQPAPSISLVSPAADAKFEKVPADVVVTIKVSNFPLGQGNRRWQIYLDDQLAMQITDGATSATLKAVRKGDYALKVALATDDKTVVATDGVTLKVGAEEEAPKTTPKTGAADLADLSFALLLALSGLSLLGVAKVLRSITANLVVLP